MTTIVFLGQDREEEEEKQKRNEISHRDAEAETLSGTQTAIDKLSYLAFLRRSRRAFHLKRRP